MTRTPENGCCENWLKAQEDETDNERCYPLLEYFEFPGLAKGWHIGSNLPPIQFCPWCGAKVNP